MNESPQNSDKLDDSESIQGTTRLGLWNRPAVRTAAYTVGLGIVGSGVWDLIAKPGLGGVGRSLLSAATFGSTRVRDISYESAALDPFPLVGLLVLGLISSLPISLVGYFWARTFRRASNRDTLKEEITSIEQAHSAIEDRHRAVMLHLNTRKSGLERQLKRTGLVGLVYAACLTVAALVTFGIINEATATRRVFFANLATIAPYISDLEEESLKSQFAQIRTKSAYEAVEKSMTEIATAHGIAIRKVGSAR